MDAVALDCADFLTMASKRPAVLRMLIRDAVDAGGGRLEGLGSAATAPASA